MPKDVVSYFYKLILSPVFLSAFFAWFGAQLMKTVIDTFKRKAQSSKDMVATLMWKTGGMPSSHSSTVTALATSIGITLGVDSPLFLVGLFYGILTIRDALGVRKAAGNQAKALNKLGGELAEKYGIPFKPVKEIHGHTVAEVAVGVLLGFFIALAFCSL